MASLLKKGRDDEDNKGVWHILEHTDIEGVDFDTLVFIPNDLDKSKVARISVAGKNTGSPTMEEP